MQSHIDYKVILREEPIVKEVESTKQKYESPVIEVIVFSLEDSIALSGDYGPDLACSGEVFGG